MPKIRDLLTHARSTAQTRTPKDQLKDLFATVVAKGLNNYEGNASDVDDFLSWFTHAVNAEDKPGELKARRVEALEMVKKEAARAPITAFPKVNREKFFFQLGVYIREPQLMNQAQTGLCGPTAKILQLAKSKPDLYAKAATDIYRGGSAKLGQIVVTAHPKRQLKKPSRGLGECDYVVLTSIRNNPLIFGNDPRGFGEDGLNSLQVCIWLRQAGYVQVENHSIIDSQCPEAIREASLRKMAEKLSLGHGVIMLEDSRISDAFSRNREIRGPTGESNHLVYVNKLILNPTHVCVVKAYPYGLAATRKDILKSLFLAHYYGFVSFIDEA